MWVILAIHASKQGPLRVCVRGGTLVDYAKARAEISLNEPGQPVNAAYLHALAKNPTLAPRDFIGLIDSTIRYLELFLKKPVWSWIVFVSFLLDILFWWWTQGAIQLDINFSMRCLKPASFMTLQSNMIKNKLKQQLITLIL